MWSLRELLQVSEVASVTVAVPEPWQAIAGQELEGSGLTVPWSMAPAGTTRTESTWNAAETLAAEREPAADDLVAVHDAARPFVTFHLLLRLAAAAVRHGAAVPGVRVPDTVVQIEQVGSGEHERAAALYLERASLVAVQTPQVFRWSPFHAAHRWCNKQGASYTDDGSLLAARGLQPVVVMGEPDNWKITTDNDWSLAEAVLRPRTED